jgi:predicted SnoaL-like aldol condensation-catalyzing enzyme
MVPLALAGIPQRSAGLPCSTTNPSDDNYADACLQEPYCPGREVDERLQRDLFADFLKILYGEKNVSKAFETYVDPNIIEHDPEDAQDRDAIVARLSQIIPFANLTILASNFNNNIGLAHVKVDEDPEPAALADIYRMEGTCIVEHWDVIQLRPANSTNPIAMF